MQVAVPYRNPEHSPLQALVCPALQLSAVLGVMATAMAATSPISFGAMRHVVRNIPFMVVADSVMCASPDAVP